MDREAWPKPINAPSMADDPVAHLKRRRPQDRSAMQLATIRVQGGARDGEEFMIPLDDIRDVFDRAALFRASHWSDLGKPEIMKGEMPVILGDSPLPMTMPQGWIMVGKISDIYAGPYWLRVWWNELTDRIKVERPPAPKELPVHETAPIHLGHAGGVPTQPIVATAQPAFIYSFMGQDYTAAEAEQLVTQQGNLSGWTWRGKEE